MKLYKLFRVFAGLSLAIIVGLSALVHFDILDDVWVVVLTPVFATLATIFSGLIAGPADPADALIPIDKLLAQYDIDTLAQLKDAKEQESEIRRFIDNKSMEVFYQRIHHYLRGGLEKKYPGSEVAGLVAELTNVEAEMDRLKLEYDEAKLPARFRAFLTRQEKERNVALLGELIDVFPYLPFKGLIKLYLKLRYFGDVEL